MAFVETELTPELAAQLLSNPHPKQRRAGPQKVAQYTRAIKEGRWRLIPDPLLVTPEGQMFNGAHRCSAVIAAHRSIPVYIDWEADFEVFDVIDVGRRREAYQFVPDGNATERAAAARIMLWYERRFDQPLHARSLQFDVQEILAKVEDEVDSLTAVMLLARSTNEYTSMPRSVPLAVYAIAYKMGYYDELEAFVRGLVDPFLLDAEDPVRLLADRFRKETHRTKRRSQGDDYTLLTRTLNLHLEGKLISKLYLTDVWPRVAETDADFRRRRNALKTQKAYRQSADGKANRVA